MADSRDSAGRKRRRCNKCGKDVRVKLDGGMFSHQCGPKPTREQAAESIRKYEAYLDNKFKLEYGAVFAAVRADDAPALRRAIAEDSSGLTRRLRNQQQPLHHAIVEKKSPEVVQILLEAGAPPNEWCGRVVQCVPLHYAAGAGMMEHTRLLLEHGADPSLVYQDPESYSSSLPHEMAQKNGHKKVSELIRSKLPADTTCVYDDPPQVNSPLQPGSSSNLLQNLTGSTKDLILFMANGLGAGQYVRRGIPFLKAYALALEVSRESLVQLLRKAPGELGEYGEVMDDDELKELGCM